MKAIVLALSCLFVGTSLAAASIATNSISPNGLGPNGLGPNGLGPNGVEAAAVSADRDAGVVTVIGIELPDNTVALPAAND